MVKSLLITGGCGFIGSHFINYIAHKYPDYFICCIDAMYYCSKLANINPEIRESKNFVFVNSDINNISLVTHLLSVYKITDIIHFAAQSHVDNSFEDALQYTHDNVLGTHTLLESVRKTNKNIRFYHFSTDEVYGESEQNDDPKQESSLLCPTNPYAATKAAAEMLVNAYKHSYGLQTIITRCNNVYGENQYPEKLIPKFISQLRNNIPVTIHGCGNALRTFIHVDDVCSAVDVIMTNGIFGETYNIGSDDEYSVLEVAEILISLCKPDDCIQRWITFVTDRPFNDKRYFINSDKIKKLGWKNEKNFKSEIHKLVQNVTI